MTDFGENFEQKRAVVSNSKRILVLAGAGSGKTKVLTRRFIHLVKNKSVKEEDILAITFTKNAAKEMRERIAPTLDVKEESLRKNVRTFHSFCMSILRQNEQFDLITEKDQKELVERIISNLSKDEEIANSIYAYIKDNILEKMRAKDRQDNTYSSFKDKPEHNGIKKQIKTESGIYVKSKSERDIANFLTSLGLEWKYEPEVKWGDGPFKPDFLIEDQVYLEHWCYNDKTPEITGIDKKKYLKNRKWKENQFKKHKKVLISVEENEMLDLLKLQIKLKDIIENLLKRELQKKDILELLELSPVYRKSYDHFVEEIIEIINLAKSELLDVKDVESRVKNQKKEKIISFYEVLIPVMGAYEDITKTSEFGKKDFNDLMKDAVNLLKNNKERREYYQNKVKYLLVDEFQDVSFGQVELLKL